MKMFCSTHVVTGEIASLTELVLGGEAVHSQFTLVHLARVFGIGPRFVLTLYQVFPVHLHDAVVTGVGEWQFVYGKKGDSIFSLATRI